MDVSIVIVNYKSRRLIMQQLRYFFSTPTRSAVEVLVVDNASHDGIAEVLVREFPQVKTVELTENKGFGSGNNAGIVKATGRYIVLCNPDIVLTADAVDLMCGFFLPMCFIIYLKKLTKCARERELNTIDNADPSDDRRCRWMREMLGRYTTR